MNAQQCTATSKRTHERCKANAMTGRDVCYHHGGKTPRGIASPHWKGKGRGRYPDIPERLLDTYTTAQEDPELLNLTSEIALVESRMNDLLSRVDTGEAGKLWADLRKVIDDTAKDFDNDNLGGVRLGLMKADRIIGEGLTDYAAWAEVGALMEQRRKLTESEGKRLVAMQQIITSEQAVTLVSMLLTAVKENVKDRREIEAVRNRFNVIVNAGEKATK